MSSHKDRKKKITLYVTYICPQDGYECQVPVLYGTISIQDDIVEINIRSCPTCGGEHLLELSLDE